MAALQYDLKCSRTNHAVGVTQLLNRIDALPLKVSYHFRDSFKRGMKHGLSQRLSLPFHQDAGTGA